ncbi:hypothetical protein AVEN_118368-1 [Araneus ventricosus]|uniref:Uncharacterized protein n=1 Tax=Araneus ventricosus TaxID=182803 RepID=A0A4Y2B5E2_ARAVE|nr:hypothetical protein AVEN_118368-1 [Araneus ventricosus]
METPVKLKTKSGEVLPPTLRLYPVEVSEHEKQLFQKCEPLVKTFTCDDSSAAERDSLDKAESDEPTSRYHKTSAKDVVCAPVQDYDNQRPSNHCCHSSIFLRCWMTGNGTLVASS